MTVTLNKVLPNLKLTSRRTMHMAATLPDLQCSARSGNNLWQEDTEDHFLPALKIEIGMGERANLEAKLPVLSVVGYGGAFVSAAPDLPALSLSASAVGGAVGSLNRKLPVLTAEGNMAARLDGTLPALRLTSATFGRGSLLSLEKTLPGLTVSASCFGGGGATLEKSIPALELLAISSGSGLSASMAGDLPVVRLSATIGHGGAGTLSKYLPDLQLIASSYMSCGMSLDADLPPLIVLIPPGGTGSAQSGQFDDYILRHRRW